MEKLEQEPGVSWGFPLASLASTSLLGVRVGPKVLEQKPWGSCLSGFHFLKCIVSLFSAALTLPQRRTMLEQEGSEWVLGIGQSTDSGSLSTSQSSRPLLIHCQQCPFLPHSDALLGLGCSVLCSPLSLLWSCSTKQAELESVLDLSRSTCQGSHRKPAGVLGSFSLLPLPCFGSKQTCMHSSQAKSRVITALLSVPLVFRSAKGTHPSLLKEDIQVPPHSSSSVSPLRSAGLRLISPFPLYWILCDSYLQPW